MMNFLKIKKIILAISVFSLFFVTVLNINLCAAQTLNDWSTNLEVGGTAAGYSPDVKTPDSFIEVIIKTVLSFLGVLFLILMIYGGFLWMTARGNEEQVTKSKNLIIAAIIGLLIILASYAISIFVINSLSGSTLDFPSDSQ